jgi:PTS system sucrose-specific IIC component
VLGDGVGIEPEVGLVVAPFDGEIANVAETGHAIGLEGPGDMELLIHIGVDTVKMKGKGFHPLVKEGDHVTAGQKLLEFDRDEIAKAGFPDTVVVLLTNSDDYEDVKCYGDLQKEEE